MSSKFRFEEYEVAGSGNNFIGIAGEALTNRELVRIGAAGTLLGADASAAATLPAVGITLAAATTGQHVLVLVKGFVGLSTWTWTAGGRIYVSDVAGALTQTAGTVTQEVGVAQSATQIWFDPQGLDTGVDALIYARERPAASQGPRNTLNFVEGANVTITVADNVPNAEIDITIASAAGVNGNCVWWIEAPNPDTYHGAYAGQNLADGVETNVRMTSAVPSNFAAVISADVIVISDSSGDMVWNCTAEFHEWCSNEDYNAHNAEFGANQTTAIVADKTECLDISALLANLAVDDILGLRFRRYGADGSDTVSDAVKLLGVIIVVCSA